MPEGVVAALLIGRFWVSYPRGFAQLGTILAGSMALREQVIMGAFITFVVLRCNDLVETRRFYGGVLRLSVRDTAEGTLTVEAFGGKLIFTESDLWNSAPFLSGTIYFTVPDVDALFSQVSQSAPVAWGPEDASYGSREFAIRDCNGYYLAFRQAV